MGIKIPFQHLLVGLCTEAEILQGLDFHNYVCVEMWRFWFGALLEGLFHTLEWKYAQNNAHFWEQKFLLLLLII